MTTIERPVELWSTMPGWGIVANLTPPELIAARKLKTIRKALVASFAALLVIGIGLYMLAFLGHRSAVSELSQEQARTTQLIAEQHKYQRAVQVRNSIDEVQRQLGGLLTDDVDQATLVARIRAKLPAGMTISQLTITIDAASGTTAPPAGAGSLDASGSTHIGTVTLAGNEQHISDVAAFVNALAALPGVVTPYPGSSSKTDTSVQWSAQLTLTADLLTHRYDTAKKGSK
ncbi:MAG: hypothetical protein M3Y42_14920 [Actinomycetota bacterium]|nr:hypothetical protein [Actinomycetota bacterium]